MTECKPKTLHFSNLRKQSGVALVVTMILLTVISLLSVSALRNTNLETKIAVNHQFKELSFQAAESALAVITGSAHDNFDIPATVGNTIFNDNIFSAVEEDADHKLQPDLAGDVDLTYDAEIDPDKGQGNILISGHQLDTIVHLYTADAYGIVEGNNAKTHNRMQIALIRQDGDQ